MAPTEAAQEGAERRGRLHREAEDPSGATRAQGIRVVDAVTAPERGHHERQELVADVRPPRCLPEIEMLVDQLAQAQVVGQGGRQHQARVGHQMVVVEGRVEAVEGVR
jgi:hypothetical protein